MVAVDHADEQLPALYRRGQRHDDHLVMADLSGAEIRFGVVIRGQSGSDVVLVGACAASARAWTSRVGPPRSASGRRHIRGSPCSAITSAIPIRFSGVPSAASAADKRTAVQRGRMAQHRTAGTAHAEPLVVRDKRCVTDQVH